MVFKKLIRKNKKSPESDNAIVGLDIGTEYIKALIAKVEGDKLTVVGVGRAHQKTTDMHAGAIADISSVVRNCDQALNQAEEQAGFQARKTVIGIAGELVKGVTHTIRYRRPQPDRVLDENEMNFIINKVQERALVKAQKQISLETGNENVEVKLVNSALVSLHIDGYKVSNPIGFQGRDVAVQIYTAFAPMVHIGALESVAEELDLDLIAVAAEPFAVSRSVIGTDSSSNFTAILADVGGGTTDIAVVNEGGVEGTKMFSIGGRSFTRAIGRELDVSFEDAENIKLNIDKPNLKKEVSEDANRAIDKALDVWLSGIELCLSEFETLDQLPTQILLCGGGSSLNKLVSRLSDHAWPESLPFVRRPVVKHISPEEVVGIKDTTDKVDDHTYITALGLLRVGQDTLQNEDSDDFNFKDKLNKILRI